ncbi:MAG: hypothetical protein KZQ66_15685 [Candidatus Thiodiazotropha sp. (ex Lucinoma aequizonata)]|nr:hypothetical protein [Candidatus Thiodiazotropha sp. (ex Lucinoma aequizonata)]MCU7903253.1 hypothetical protein [Candidatus Thiodiazotropha sp. (ex Lucinoma aequizonata)]MCU7913797.1 hypothetical protein [Candidatus Thiodiazotropha sp. (ex Lucinoma aequizonata)]
MHPHRKPVRSWRSVCTPIKRWTDADGVKADGRPDAERPEPANKLKPEERQQILETCNEEAYRSLPPSQMVPALADKDT